MGSRAKAEQEWAELTRKPMTPEEIDTAARAWRDMFECGKLGSKPFKVILPRGIITPNENEMVRVLARSVELAARNLSLGPARRCAGVETKLELGPVPQFVDEAPAIDRGVDPERLADKAPPPLTREVFDQMRRDHTADPSEFLGWGGGPPYRDPAAKPKTPADYREEIRQWKCVVTGRDRLIWYLFCALGLVGVLLMWTVAKFVL
jgi:hypothetical protein